MVFNSWDFVVFFLLVYLVYASLPRWQWQNWFLLLASYYFYAAWDWRFAFLMLASTLVDFTVGVSLGNARQPRTRKALLIVSLCFSLGLLGVFKYCNFFIGSLTALLANLGISAQTLHLDIILPCGISFYTFQTMSYTIDVYRREVEPCRNLRDFALFVAFFPQLVAGPVARAGTLLPQVTGPRTLAPERFVTAAWLIGWGLWKKIFVADNLALLVDPLFASSATLTAAEAYLAVLAFAFQIYCDFSAYSDIARGTARVLGFELPRNFNLPYFAVNPSDFWKRWHISFSTWLRDYLYIPLGGNRAGPLRTQRNLFLTMVLGGLWHGAAWNFVWWGVYHGLLLIGHRIWTSLRSSHEPVPTAGRISNSSERTDGLEIRPTGSGLLGHWLAVALMFQFTLFGWLLFRSTRKIVLDGVPHDDSFAQIGEMLLSYRHGLGLDASTLLLLSRIAFFTWPLLIVQCLQYRTRDHYCMLRWPLPVRVGLVSWLSLTWVLWGVEAGATFIYFQF
jgi:D-alanyl-lipoteichoic acid acyltransferase DltB (MBOAT superfamily)